MNENTPTRGQRLRAIRKGLQWTQLQLGDFLGVGQTLIHRAENDDPKVQPIVWIALTSFCRWVEARGIRTEDLDQPKNQGFIAHD